MGWAKADLGHSSHKPNGRFQRRPARKRTVAKPPILVGRAERRDVRFREGEQRSRASDMGAILPVKRQGERLLSGMAQKPR